MTCAPYEADAGRLLECLRFASDVLYQLTGRQWPGECEHVIRPTADFAVTRQGWWPAGTAADARGSWGSCSCNRARRTGCYPVSEIKLADRVLEVTEVKVDGEVVPSTEWRLDDHRYLVGLLQPDDSPRVWPCCQRVDLPDTEVGTFSVAFKGGGLPPIGGTIAAASLACEIGKAIGVIDLEDSPCRLPKRVTSITRQGVSVAVLDPLTLFQEGRTGLAEVDMWVASVQQGRARRRATIFPLGRGRGQRRPGT